MELSLREFLKLGSDEPGRLEDPEFQARWVDAAVRAKANPLLLFDPHSDAQRRFIEADTPIIAAFAGNRFGKSTVLAACALREALDADMLPPALKATKR